MRMKWFVPIAAFSAAAALPAQEFGVFATGSRPGPWKDVAVGGGVSVAAFMRFGSIFAESTRLSKAQLQVGFRLGVSEARGSLHTTWWCVECGPQEPRTLYTRLRSTQYSLLFLPYRSRSARLELGGGMVTHSFRGDIDANIPAFVATASVSRRLARELPLWAAAGFEYHRTWRKWYEVWPADGTSASTPRHSARLGLLVRR